MTLALFDDSAAPEVARVIETRLVHVGWAAARVSARAGRVVVSLGELAPGDRAIRERLLTTKGQWQLVPVVAGDPAMRKLIDAVLADPEAQRAGVAMDTESWSGVDDEPRHSDAYLTAADRDRSGRRILEEALGRAGAAFVEQERLLGAGRRIAYGWLGPGRWRSYLVDRGRAIAPSVVQATIDDDPRAGASVVVMLAEGSARELATLTGETLGQKVAIVIDGVVYAAPVVMSKIDGGKLAITMGGSRQEQLRDARLLAAVLASGPLPTAVRIDAPAAPR